MDDGKSGGWVGVDLDGTLAKYDGMPADGSIGEPIPNVVAAVKGLLEKGIEVRIVTARAQSKDDLHQNVPALDFQEVEKVQDWCEKNIGKRLPVIFWKDYQMIELWDDRAIQFIKNEGVPIAYFASRVSAIASKMYHWAIQHKGNVPPVGWDELRVALGIPAPAEPSRIIKSTVLPKSPKID
jgi:hypothetical protein